MVSYEESAVIGIVSPHVKYRFLGLVWGFLPLISRSLITLQNFFGLSLLRVTQLLETGGLCPLPDFGVSSYIVEDFSSFVLFLSSFRDSGGTNIRSSLLLLDP
jgi:hypothetical protein